MTLERVVLELPDVDFGGSIGTVTGVFHMYGDAEITESIRTGFVVGGRGSTVNGIVQSTLGTDQPMRKGVYVDLGGGQHTLEVQFIGWEGAQDTDGNSLQWGSSASTTTVNAATATGAAPTTQMQVFINYLRHGTFGSISPARARFGEYSDGTYGVSAGSMDDYLPVAIESPSFTRSAGENTTYNGSLTLVEALTTSDALDAAAKLGY